MKKDQPLLPLCPKTLDIIAGLFIFFEHDYKKCIAWLTTENLNFGGASPLDLIIFGKANKVLKFVNNSVDGNYP